MSKDEPTTKVTRFPPLPRIPTPPQFPPDPRQQQTSRIIGNIARAVEHEMKLSGPNLVKGFPASAVNLGQLKDALESGVQRLDAEQVAERWDEVFDWIRSVIVTWVQRYKMLKIERLEDGIRIEMTTQDDHGYYDYAFDVFPKQAKNVQRNAKGSAEETQ